MALDTQEKRYAVPGVARPWWRSKLPTADKDEQWRSATGWTYGGNALSPSAVFTAGEVYNSRIRGTVFVPHATGRGFTFTARERPILYVPQDPR